MNPRSPGAIAMSRRAAHPAPASAAASIRALVAALVCALVAALSVSAPAARADIFGPISLVSEGALGVGEAQQVEYAHDTALSGNGHYLTFDGSIGGVSGVWRRDLSSGGLEQVAGGDAELPSISESGQYVSFTTNEGLSLAKITDGKRHEPAPEAVNVYVRDMSKAPGEPGAFTAVSAVDGSEEPLTYSGAGTTLGSAAVGRSAISADGNEVAFVTTAVSNLLPYPQLEGEEEAKGEVPQPHTPPLQVAVRYLDTHETQLVSRCYLTCEAAVEPAVESSEDGQTYGAVYPGLSAAFAPAPPYGEYGPSPPPGASISADGSTVAWIGENVGHQAQMLPQESRSAHYTEPLWRRIAAGSETPTERVTGGSDPTNPACVSSGETSLPANPSSTDPCLGPFVVEEQPHVTGILTAAGGQIGDFPPRLSSDGYTVLFISEAPLVSLGENFGRNKLGQPSDLYLADMHPGLTRDQALTPLTELAGGEGANIAATAPIFDFEISSDASQVAFSTRRTQFILGSPAYVSPPAGEPGLNELFDVDLLNDTLTRVTHGYLGLTEPSEHAHKPRASGEEPYENPGDGALSPSMSSDGNILAFSSTASNLAFGDANAPPAGQAGPLDGSDAFVTERVTFAALPTQQYISPAPQIATEPAWRLGVSTLTRADGSVLLYVSAPGAGMLRAVANSLVTIRVASKAARRARRSAGRRARVGRASAGRRTGAGRASASSRKAHETIVSRAVATASKLVQAGAGEPVTLVLKLAKSYAALASQQGGLSANVSVAFSAPGEPTLRASVVASFLSIKHTSPRSGGTARHHAPHTARRR